MKKNDDRLGSKSDRAPSMAITCPSWGSTCPLWLASNQYGQDLKARAHKSEFAASTSLIFQLRNLKSPEISETFSRNLSLFPNFQTCFRRHPRCRAEECGHSKGNWSPSVFPQAKLWTWAGDAPTTPTRNR